MALFRNIFSSLPEDLSNEVVEDLVRSSSVRIERIVSRGHSSPENGWYDQDESEWVIVRALDRQEEADDLVGCFL